MCDSFSFLLLQWSIQDETEISSVTSFIFNLISQPNSNGRDIKRKISNVYRLFSKVLYLCVHLLYFYVFATTMHVDDVDPNQVFKL